jgi:hypothetical protein
MFENSCNICAHARVNTKHSAGELGVLESWRIFLCLWRLQLTSKNGCVKKVLEYFMLFDELSLLAILLILVLYLVVPYAE